MTLADLLNQATPGPWGNPLHLGSRALRAEANGAYTRLAFFDIHEGTAYEVDGVANARLAALAPDMAQLLIDMAAWMSGLMAEEHLAERPRALLVRFAALAPRTGRGIDGPLDEGRALLAKDGAGMETEVARLEHENESLREALREYATKPGGLLRLIDRREAAEAEVARLREVLHALLVEKDGWHADAEMRNLRAEAAEAEVARLREGLREIANSTYPARYLGEAKDGTKMYGGSDDASRFARVLLAEDGAAPPPPRPRIDKPPATEKHGI